MHSLALCLAAVLSLESVLASAAGTCSALPNLSISGSPFIAPFRASSTTCCNVCNAEPACKAAVYNGMCSLYNTSDFVAMPGSQALIPGTTAAPTTAAPTTAPPTPIPPPPPPTIPQMCFSAYQGGQYFEGVMLSGPSAGRSRPAGDLEDCCNECSQMTNCVAAVLTRGKCRFLAGVTQVKRTTAPVNSLSVCRLTSDLIAMYLLTSSFKGPGCNSPTWALTNPACNWEGTQCSYGTQTCRTGGVYAFALGNKTCTGVPSLHYLPVNLGSLTFEGTSFTGNPLADLGESLGTSLNTVHFNNNSFSGVVNFTVLPGSIQILSLNFNSFSGNIADQWNDLPSQVTQLYLRGNQFTGSLPTPGPNSQMTVVDVGQNNFSGQINFAELSTNIGEYWFDGNPNVCGSTTAPNQCSTFRVPAHCTTAPATVGYGCQITCPPC